MGLQNLVGISLEQITPAKETIKRLLDAAGQLREGHDPHVCRCRCIVVSAMRCGRRAVGVVFSA